MSRGRLAVGLILGAAAGALAAALYADRTREASWLALAEAEYRSCALVGRDCGYNPGPGELVLTEPPSPEVKRACLRNTKVVFGSFPGGEGAVTFRCAASPDLFGEYKVYVSRKGDVYEAEGVGYAFSRGQLPNAQSQSIIGVADDIALDAAAFGEPARPQHQLPVCAEKAPVTDDQHAIARAEKYLEAKFGRAAMEAQRPYAVRRQGDRITVVGAMRDERIAGNFHVVLDARSGCPLWVDRDV